jgi:hypothetical protein
MENTTNKGYLYGFVIDANTGEIIEQADVKKLGDAALDVVMPFKGEKEGDGIYFAIGEPDTYKIEIKAKHYKPNVVDIQITASAQRRDIYLYPDVKQFYPGKQAVSE